MTQKKYLKNVLVISLILISFGGFLLHYRTHPLNTGIVNYVPFIAGILSTIIIPAMFYFKPLVPFAFLINGMIAIIGTINMAHFSLSRWPKQLNLITFFSGTLLSDIFILWTAFFISKLLFDLELTTVNNLDTKRHKGRFFRYPNMGYWCVHLIALGVVYSLGHILWK
jgi:hypothetical protein